MAFPIGPPRHRHAGRTRLCFYWACAIFVFAVMSAVAGTMGLNMLKILRFVKEAFVIVLVVVE